MSDITDKKEEIVETEITEAADKTEKPEEAVKPESEDKPAVTEEAAGEEKPAEGQPETEEKPAEAEKAEEEPATEAEEKPAEAEKAEEAPATEAQEKPSETEKTEEKPAEAEKAEPEKKPEAEKKPAETEKPAVEEKPAEEPAPEKSRFAEKLKKVPLGKLIVLTLAVSAAVFALVYGSLILFRPQALFKTDSTGETASSATEKVELHGSDKKDEPAAEKPEPAKDPDAIPDTGILNILLCGIDGYEDGSSTSGSQPHTDANVVISINFDKGTVDLTSILRDSFSVAPGYYGYYKFNSIFNIRGGVYNPNESMELTCAAAEQWMGGISIPYYYALDFQAVIDVVNAIGGVDYDVEFPFEDIHYRWVPSGHRHLNGDEVMGYMRIRTAADGLDSSRTARQRKMLLAIFDQIKRENLFSALPAIINSASSGIYTNTTLAQTAALAKYAMTLDQEKIYTHSLVSDLRYNYDWVLNFPKAEERKALLKQIYGIDAENVKTGSEAFETYLYQSGFVTIKHIRQAEKVLKNVNEQLKDGLELTEWQKTLYYGTYASYSRLVDEFDKMPDFVDERRDEGRIGIMNDPEFKARIKEMSDIQSDVKLFTEQLRDELCPELKLEWRRSKRWDQDPDIDQVVVDFA